MATALLIVDPQLDFISGSLPVPGAEAAIAALSGYIEANPDRYGLKVATCDWHPDNHCSFRENGGQWPSHCVAGTRGAAIWPGLEAALERRGFLTVKKGRDPGQDEYSAFCNEGNRKLIVEAFRAHAISQVDICGIAGDFCVLNTLKDGAAILGNSFFRVLSAFTPSLDNGAALAGFCSKEAICIR